MIHTSVSSEQLSPDKLSPQSSLGTGSQYQSNSTQEAYFHYAVVKYLYNEKDGNKSKKFQLKELFKSEYLKQYKENQIIQFIKHMTMFQLENDDIIHYVKQEI